MSATLLIVDDDATIRETLVEFFETFLWRAVGAGSSAAARAALTAHAPDVVLLDLRLPDADGVAFLDALRQEWPDVAVIVLTGHADVPTAVRSMQRGAIDLLEKPVDLDVLAATVRRALALGRLRREVRHLRDRSMAAAPLGAHGLAPETERAVLAAAAVDGPVLLRGEPGSGRGAAARCLHQWSARSSGPFVDLDAGAHTDESFATELYGVVGGRADSARGTTRGLVDLAAEGTLFIEQGHLLTSSAAERLANLLLDNHFVRVDGTTPQRATARGVVAMPDSASEDADAPSALATLSSATVIALPPLRHRTDELLALAQGMLPDGRTLTADAEAALLAHSWPGNLRELRFVLWRAALVAPTGPIDVAALALPAAAPRPSPGPLADAEAAAIRAALEATGGNRTHAARLLGVARSTLHAKLAAAGLSDFRTAPGDSVRRD